MYDHMTEAFCIRSPFKRESGLFPNGYHEPVITIWHCDPELHGDDDSCGWSFVRLTEEDVAWAEGRAKDEWKFWFGSDYDSINLSRADNFEILSLVWLECRHRAKGIARNKRMTSWDMGEVLSLLYCSGDNFIGRIKDAKIKEGELAELFTLTLRVYKTRVRPWYKKPRWHIHHWRFQIHPLQQFNRWAFSRCAKCGKGFKWGYSPVSGQWNGDGPRFLKGERNVYHMDCYKMPDRSCP